MPWWLPQLEEESSSCLVASLVRYIKTHSIITGIFGVLISALIHGIAWRLRSDRVRGQDTGADEISAFPF